MFCSHTAWFVSDVVGAQVSGYDVIKSFCAMLFIIIPPANCVCGRVYCFHGVRPTDRTNDRPTERVSVTFCFLNNFKNH